MPNFNLVVNSTEAGVTLSLSRPTAAGAYSELGTLAFSSDKVLSWNIFAGAISGSKNFSDEPDERQTSSVPGSFFDEDPPRTTYTGSGFRPSREDDIPF